MAQVIRSVDDLIKLLNREKTLLQEMFQKRKSLSFRKSYAMELIEYKEQRIQYLIDVGVIRESGNFLELEDVYLRFFEDVLQVNEEINVSSIHDYIDSLNENIDYYLKENNDKRKNEYLRNVRRILKNISLITVRNVIDLKRNVDNTYKNEPNYLIKKQKLQKLDEKRDAISKLIHTCESIIDKDQITFFRVAMDVQMRDVIADVKYQLNESYHNLVDINRQVINYLGLIEYQNRLLKKIRQLKYLKDQVTIEEYTNIREVVSNINPVWMETRPTYPLKLSLSSLINDDVYLDVLKKVVADYKLGGKKRKQEKHSIDASFLDSSSQTIEVLDQNEIHSAFQAQQRDLYAFLKTYPYHKEVSREEQLVLFCQIASQFSSLLDISNNEAEDENIIYPLIYPK